MSTGKSGVDYFSLARLRGEVPRTPTPIQLKLITL
jgi:hypothetical protein